MFWTFVQATLGVWVASNVFDFSSISFTDSLLAGLSAGVLAVAKVLLAYATDKNNGGQLGVDSVEVKPDAPA